MRRATIFLALSLWKPAGAACAGLAPTGFLLDDDRREGASTSSEAAVTTASSMTTILPIPAAGDGHGPARKEQRFPQNVRWK